MRWFRWGKQQAVIESAKQAEARLAQIEQATADLKERVKRLEAEGQAFRLSFQHLLDQGTK